MNRSLFRYLAPLLMISLMSGCGGISVDNLIPSTSISSTPRFEKTLKVHMVTGAQEEYFGGPEMVSKEEYTEGLVKTLQQSNLFQQVVTDKPGDFELFTTIIFQGLDHDLAGRTLLSFNNAMIIDYRIVDALSKNPLWQKKFNSHHIVTIGEAFTGAARSTMAQEGSARKNLEKFITSLASAKLE